MASPRRVSAKAWPRAAPSRCASSARLGEGDDLRVREPPVEHPLGDAQLTVEDVRGDLGQVTRRAQVLAQPHGELALRVRCEGVRPRRVEDRPRLAELDRKAVGLVGFRCRGVGVGVDADRRGGAEVSASARRPTVVRGLTPCNVRRALAGSLALSSASACRAFSSCAPGSPTATAAAAYASGARLSPSASRISARRHSASAWAGSSMSSLVVWRWLHDRWRPARSSRAYRAYRRGLSRRQPDLMLGP